MIRTLPEGHNSTTARFKRSLSEAFPDVRAECFGIQNHILASGCVMYPRAEEEHEREVAANRSRFDEHSTPIRTRASDMRLAGLRRTRIAVGRRSVWRRVWLALRDTLIYITGSRA